MHASCTFLVPKATSILPASPLFIIPDLCTETKMECSNRTPTRTIVSGWLAPDPFRTGWDAHPSFSLHAALSCPGIGGFGERAHGQERTNSEPEPEDGAHAHAHKWYWECAEQWHQH